MKAIGFELKPTGSEDLSVRVLFWHGMCYFCPMPRNHRWEFQEPAASPGFVCGCLDRDSWQEWISYPKKSLGSFSEAVVGSLPATTLGVLGPTKFKLSIHWTLNLLAADPGSLPRPRVKNSSH